MDGLTPDDRTRENDLAELRTAWVNEKTCPEILEHKEMLVQRLMLRVREQEEALAKTTAEDTTGAGLLWMDVNRAKFLLRAYMRTRLTKIEAHVMHICMTEHLIARLTELETDFARNFAMLVDAHFRESVLGDMPEPYNSIVEQIEEPSNPNQEDKKFDMVPEPNLDTHVFCRVVEDIGNIEIDRDTMDLQKDELLVIRYKLIRRLLEEGHVNLV